MVARNNSAYKQMDIVRNLFVGDSDRRHFGLKLWLRRQKRIRRHQFYEMLREFQYSSTR
jgi:hypothetical protein